MKSFKVIVGIGMLVLLVTGCATSTTINRVDETASLTGGQSYNWCQERYYSASVSHRQKQDNSKYCDDAALTLEHSEKKRQRPSEGQ